MPSGVAKKTRPANPAKTAYARVPTRSKAADPPAYTKTPHAYGDILIAGNKLGGALHRDILYWIERHTWGTNVSKRVGEISRPEFAKLSLSQLAKLCGGVQRTSIAIALAYLTKYKIIEARDRAGCGKTTAKMYKLTPEHWRAAPEYSPPGIEEAAAAVDPDEEQDQDDIPDDETQGYTVAPGRVSKPQAVTIQPKDGVAVIVRVSYSPAREFAFPVSFRARSGKNGRLHISAIPQTTTEQMAKHCTGAPVQSFAKYSPSPEDTKQFNEFDACVNAITREFFGIAADDDLVRKVITAAAGAPFELFNTIARLRLKRRRKGDVPGLLPHLAMETARNHAKNSLLLAQGARGNAPEEYRPLSPAEMRERCLLAGVCPECFNTGNMGTFLMGVFMPNKNPLIACVCGGKGQIL